MLRLLPRLFISAFCVFFTVAVFAQIDTTQPTSVDHALLGIANAKVPKEYTVRSIKIT